LNRAVTCSRFNKNIMCFSFDFGTKDIKHYFSMSSMSNLAN
jgi:hypothetical protein